MKLSIEADFFCLIFELVNIFLSHGLSWNQDYSKVYNIILDSPFKLSGSNLTASNYHYTLTLGLWSLHRIAHIFGAHGLEASHFQQNLEINSDQAMPHRRIWSVSWVFFQLLSCKLHKLHQGLDCITSCDIILLYFDNSILICGVRASCYRASYCYRWSCSEH